MNWITAILEIAKQLSKPFASWWSGYQIRREYQRKIDRLEASDKRRRRIDEVIKQWREAKTVEEKDFAFNEYLDVIRSID